MRYSMTFTEAQYDELITHLWADRSVERAAYLLCRISASPTETRLLVRSVWPVLDEDVEEKSAHHMRIRQRSFLRSMKDADRKGEAFVFVHSHPDGVFTHSPADDETELSLFATAYHRIHGSSIHASLVIADPRRPIGRVWLRDRQTRPVDVIRVIGKQFRFYFPVVDGEPVPEFFDRQVRAFGEDTQRLLKRLTVGVVGAGGTGSAVIQQLTRLGVGRLVIADGETFDQTNVNRVYGSRLIDGGVAKTKIAERAIADVGVGTNVEIINEPITFRSSLMQFRDCDVIFGCTDEEWGRSLLTRFAIYYSIPVFDMGVRIKSTEGVIESIQGRVTTLLPSTACLWCRGRLVSERVAAESQSVLDPVAYQALLDEGYVPELADTAPAVIPFTSSIAASAIGEFLHRLTGFLGSERESSEVAHLFTDTRLRTNNVPRRAECFCASDYYINRGDVSLFLDTTWRSE